MFSHPFPNAFGIDISDLSVKVVKLQNVSHRRRNASYELQDYRSIALPPGLIVNGIIQEPEKVRKYISHLLEGRKKHEKPIKGHWAVASIPEAQSFVKLIHIPKEIPDIIEEEIIDIAKKHIPFDEDDSFFDWQILPQKKGQTKSTAILLVATPQTIARNYTYLIESLGLGVVALENEALSISRAMVTAQKAYDGEARAILDLGATHSSMIIHDHDIIQFTVSLPYSGELVTTALSQRLQISREDAEKIKTKYGLFANTKSKYGKKAWSVIASQTNTLMKEVQKAINFYYSHFPNADKVTKIVLSGGAANLKRLDDVMSHKLHIDCTRGNPWKNLSHRKKINLKVQTSLGYATAVGLALRAADNPFFKKDII